MLGVEHARTSSCSRLGQSSQLQCVTPQAWPAGDEWQGRLPAAWSIVWLRCARPLHVHRSMAHACRLHLLTCQASSKPGQPWHAHSAGVYTAPSWDTALPYAKSITSVAAPTPTPAAGSKGAGSSSSSSQLPPMPPRWAPSVLGQLSAMVGVVEVRRRMPG